MIMTGLVVGFVFILTGVWRYYHCEKRTGKTISICLIAAGIYGKLNIINCHKTILQTDAAEYDAAVRADRKSAQTQN